jgi:hypothetical protein
MSTATLTVNDSKEALLARIAELEKVKTLAGRQFKITTGLDKDGKRVNDGGQVSVYGVGRFPITKTYTQWQMLAKLIPALLAFLEEHKTECSFRTEEQKEAAGL